MNYNHRELFEVGQENEEYGDFTCGLCGATFKDRKWNAQRHLRDSHCARDDSGNVIEAAMVCQFCHQGYPAGSFATHPCPVMDMTGTQASYPDVEHPPPDASLHGMNFASSGGEAAQSGTYPTGCVSAADPIITPEHQGVVSVATGAGFIANTSSCTLPTPIYQSYPDPTLNAGLRESRETRGSQSWASDHMPNGGSYVIMTPLTPQHAGELANSSPCGFQTLEPSPNAGLDASYSHASANCRAYQPQVPALLPVDSAFLPSYQRMRVTVTGAHLGARGSSRGGHRGGMRGGSRALPPRFRAQPNAGQSFRQPTQCGNSDTRRSRGTATKRSPRASSNSRIRPLPDTTQPNIKNFTVNRDSFRVPKAPLVPKRRASGEATSAVACAAPPREREPLAPRVPLSDITEKYIGSNTTATSSSTVENDTWVPFQPNLETSATPIGSPGKNSDINVSHNTGTSPWSTDVLPGVSFAGVHPLLPSMGSIVGDNFNDDTNQGNLLSTNAIAYPGDILNPEPVSESVAAHSTPPDGLSTSMNAIQFGSEFYKHVRISTASLLQSAAERLAEYQADSAALDGAGSGDTTILETPPGPTDLSCLERQNCFVQESPLGPPASPSEASLAGRRPKISLCLRAIPTSPPGNEENTVPPTPSPSRANDRFFFPVSRDFGGQTEGPLDYPPRVMVILIAIHFPSRDFTEAEGIAVWNRLKHFCEDLSFSEFVLLAAGAIVVRDVEGLAAKVVVDKFLKKLAKKKPGKAVLIKALFDEMETNFNPCLFESLSMDDHGNLLLRRGPAAMSALGLRGSVCDLKP